MGSLVLPVASTVAFGGVRTRLAAPGTHPRASWHAGAHRAPPATPGHSPIRDVTYDREHLGREPPMKHRDRAPTRPARLSVRARRAAATAVSALALASALAAGPPPAAAIARPTAQASRSGCITRLPVTVSVPSHFAAAYKRVVRVTVTSRGPFIRHLRVVLYTFSGDQLGIATKSSLSGSAVLRLRLRYRLQPGEFTLYAEGEPNADPSCGPKHDSRVLRFRDCITRLPVTFPEPPGGTAADYGRFLSFALSSRGPLIRHLRVRIYSFDGRFFGATRLPVLFGSKTVDMPLRRALTAGDYTISVWGSIVAQPRSCGPKNAQQTLTFS